MMTSNATSNVTNMISVNSEAVSSDFHQRDAPDHAHEARDQQEARDVEPEPLHQQAEEKGRNEDLHDAPKLVARDEGPGAPSSRCAERDAEAEQRRAGEDHAQIERQVAALRAVLRPSHPAAPVVEPEQQREREQQQVHDDLDGARGRHRRRIARRRARIADDDLGSQVRAS